MISPISETESAGAVIMHLNVTERRKVQKSLEEEKQFVSTVLDTAGAIVLVLDPEWRIVRCNRAWAHVTGSAIEKMRSKSFLDLSVIFGEDQPAVNLLRASFKQQKIPESFESMLIGHDRQRHWIKWTNTVIRGKKGQVEFFIFTGIDITEHRTSEEQIRRLSKVFKDGTDPIILADLHGRVIDLNEEAVRVYGWARAELLGQPIKTIVPPERHAQADALLERCRHQEAVRNVEGLRQTKDGKIIPVLLTLSLLTDEQPMAIAIMDKDISALKGAERKVRESQERFQAFMIHSPAVTFLKDQQGRYVYVNRQFENRLKISMTDSLGKTDQQLFPSDVAGIFQKHDREVLKMGSEVETEETILNNKGQLRSWLVVKFPVHGTEGQVLLGGIAFDITERKEAETQLQDTYRQLRDLTQKLEHAREDERKRVAREVHDELGQTLTGLKFDLAWLNEELEKKGNAYQSPLVEKIHDMTNLVQTAIDTARHLARTLWPTVLEDLGLVAALKELARDFQCRTGIQADLTVSPQLQNLPHHMRLHTMLYRAAQEALTNVLRHARATKVSLDLFQEGTMLIIKIQDNGCGITPEQVTQTRSLGLRGLRERALAVGGDLRIIGQPNMGTTILIQIPIE